MALILEIKFNGGLHILLGLFAKSFEECEPVFITGIQQLTDRLDPHFFPDGMNLFRSNAFDVQHFNHPGWCIGDILFQDTQFTGIQHFNYFLTHTGADAFDPEKFFPGGVFQRNRHFLNIESGSPVGFSLKGVLPMDIHEFGKQAEVVGNGGVVHRTNLRGNGESGKKPVSPCLSRLMRGACRRVNRLSKVCLSS